MKDSTSLFCGYTSTSYVASAADKAAEKAKMSIRVMRRRLNYCSWLHLRNDSMKLSMSPSMTAWMFPVCSPVLASLTMV